MPSEGAFPLISGELHLDVAGKEGWEGEPALKMGLSFCHRCADRGPGFKQISQGHSYPCGQNPPINTQHIKACCGHDSPLWKHMLNVAELEAEFQIHLLYTAFKPTNGILVTWMGSRCDSSWDPGKGERWAGCSCCRWSVALIFSNANTGKLS